jgi:hypothetical protein
MQPRIRLSASAALDLLVYSPLDWPGKTVRLGPDSAESHLQRPSSGVPSIAEVYHANSALGPASVARLLAARTDVAELRREVIKRSAAASPRPGPDDPSPSDRVAGLLHAARNATGVDLFYGLELRVVQDGFLYAFEPLTGTCPVVAALTVADLRAVDRGLHLLEPSVAEAERRQPGAGAPGSPDALILLVGRFGRHDVLYGPRGYRRTLIEAGRLSQELLRLAGERGIRAALITEYFDHDLDRAALTDGVDDGCLAVVELESVSP